MFIAPPTSELRLHSLDQRGQPFAAASSHRRGPSLHPSEPFPELSNSGSLPGKAGGSPVHLVFLAENAKSRVKSGVFGRRGDRKLPKSIPRSRAARIGLYRHESASIGLTLRYRSLLPFIRDSYEELIPLGLLPQPWRNVFPPRQRSTAVSQKYLLPVSQPWRSQASASTKSARAAFVVRKAANEDCS